ncbi:hypothetical protein ES708_12988 [subsurface metagenome]
MLSFGKDPDEVLEDEIEAIPGLLRPQIRDVGLPADDDFYLGNGIRDDPSVRSHGREDFLLPLQDPPLTLRQKLAGQTLKCLDHRTVGDILPELVVAARNEEPTSVHDGFMHFVYQGRLPDPRLPPYKHDFHAPLARPVKDIMELLQLGIPAHQNLGNVKSE